MNPEELTGSEILRSMKAKQWVFIISAVVTVIAACFSGGFWAGQRIAESQALVQQADLKAINSQIQAKLEVAQAQLQTASIANAQMKELVERSQRAVEEKSYQVAKLTKDLGRSNNCAFVHQQIKEINRALADTDIMVTFNANPQQEEQRTRRVHLEQRLSGYQQQLGTCNK